MNFAKIFLATATLMVASISPSLANNKVEIVGASYGGSGCPDRTASVTVSPDGQELSILFDKFITLGNGKPEEARKSCNLTIPIKVPGGFQISVYTANYRGYVAPNTTGELLTEYFFAGSRGLKLKQELRGEKDYDVEHDLVTQGKVWSACGDSVNMRVNASMKAKGDGIATVDSFDLAHRGLVYRVEYRSCNK
ncbi:DUF4360 domain-containing protein [Trichormus variabilis]|uniref:DUF4360 domain-containing protein n=1 Tax=Trichormus variabilis SAG 1403-4b TaxID=447716 RepID=A0A3S1IFT2_ANAVA|nr:DUF4360 domain-containing protein [Trichormus variabilis]MBD2628036.1 DUF4360 domain-containing protein [Trichormus variabilis FACHB-164]RUS96756.1 hypothetical protein DSM107003_21620 [Trichormus variabilis SAG 1403-4b]